MKPIHLSLAGLQSYREKQEIDFTRLCDAGVFGIFGPTGSGKSSILDAMTLALYGKVERASNGTQGILNHAENTLSVAFEFELTHAEGPQRYRVERQFKRSAEISVGSTVSRLIQIGRDGSIVLADKAGDVNAGIQELLGLSMQDFTRAVVLPQGKFAEFLSLKGSDRRQMLQRLFHLEAYGDQLNARLSHRFKKADSALKQTAARLEGLGDASPSAVQSAEERLKVADEQSRNLREKRNEAEREWDGLKQILAWQQELAELSAREARQAELRPVMEEREQKLKKADQAARIRPYLDGWEAAGRLQQECGGREALLRQEKDELERLAGEADRSFTQAKAELSANDAALQVRLEQLNQALALQTDVRSILESVKARTAFRSSQAALHAECLDKLAKEQEIQTKAVKKQADLKSQLSENEVRSDHRQKLFAASVALRQLEDLDRQSADLERETGEEDRRCQTQQSEADDAEARIHALYVRILSLQSEGEEWAGRVRKLEEWRSARLASLQKAADELGRQNVERDHARMAAQLAQLLAEDHPCPVCGSDHHPLPAVTEGLDQDHGAQEAEQLTQLAGIAQERIFFLKQTGFVLRNSLGKLAGAITDIGAQFPKALSVREISAVDANPEPDVLQLPAVQAASASAAPAGPSDTAMIDPGWQDNCMGMPADPIPAAGDIELEFGRMEPLEQSADAFVREFEGRLQQLTDLLQQAVTACHKAAAQLQSARTVRQNLVERQQQLRSRAEEQRSRWSAEYPEWTPETIAGELELLDKKDKAADELKQKLEISVDFLEQKQESIATLRQQAVECEKELLKADTEIEGLNRAVADKRRELTERSGSGEGLIDEQIAAVNRQLQALRDRERETRETMERLQQELQSVSHRHTAAKQACDSADSAFSKAEANWLYAVANTEFARAEEVREAQLPEETLRAWEQGLREYRDITAELKAGLQQVGEKLNGRSIGEAERLAAETKLNEAKALDEEGLAMRARAARDLEELQSKHQIWQTLEQEKEALQEACANLSRLQQVFRGNAFVEFLAEEQLLQVSRSASERLGQLTRQRYALEVDSQGGFIIRDDANGGIKRPVSSLSGGETFLTSLSLALALSSQIQLSGQYPLEFFFLDEGFGTLDPDLLEVVVCALEKLHLDRLTVGVISHVPELKARLPRRLVVEPAEPTGRGSRIFLEVQ